MYQGSCLCGRVRYEITGDIRAIVYCHCSQCRKAQGSAFASNGIVATTHFNLIADQDQLTSYESSPRQHKYFCRTCGSPMLSRNTAHPDQVRIRLGTLDTNITERPQAHIFATSKANWEDICGDLPQYVGYEPGR